MPLADIIIVGVLIGFAYFGWKSGLIHALGSVVGTVLGIYVAGRYYEPLAAWLINFTHWNENFVKIVVFIGMFVISNRLIGVVFWLVNKIFGIVAKLPILGSIDRLLGAAFGVLEGVIVVGIAIFFITKFPPSPSFMEKLAVSKTAPPIVEFTSFLWPLLPADLLQMVSGFSGLPNFNFPELPKNFSLPTNFKIPDSFPSSTFKFPKK